MKYYLGIDVGGTVTKVGMYDALVQELAIAEKKSVILCEHPGFTERDMEEMWLTVCELVNQVIATLDINTSKIAGISFSAHGKGLYPIDKNGKVFRKGIISTDTRAQNLIKRWQDIGLDESTYTRGRQQLWASHPASLLRWMKENNPNDYDMIDSILMAHDYLRFRMTGNKFSEITNISGSNLYNIALRNYDDSLLHDFGVFECKEKLAPIINSSDCSGFITKEASTQLGLPVGIPVYAGLFDVVGSVIASGVFDSTKLSAVAGTWSIVTAVTDKIIEKKYNKYIWGEHCVGGKYFVHEGSPTSASNLEWWRSELLSNISLDECNELARVAKDRASELFYLPYLFGSNYRSGIDSSLIGLKSHHDKADIIYAIYEGIIFSHLINHDKLSDLIPEATTVRFCGGPTHSDIWMQLFADAIGLPIEIINEKQSGCKSAAIAAMVGDGLFSNFDDAIKNIAIPIRVFEPNYSKNNVLREKFGRYKELNNIISAF